MTVPRSTDRPAADPSPASTPPVVDTAPPLSPAPERSPWWSAPSGRPVSIPDFAHEFAAHLAAFPTTLLAWLFPAPQPIPVRVKARRH